MRGELICYAVVALVIAGALTLYWWDTVIDLRTRHRKYDQIREGMTPEQVEAIIGERGQFQTQKISGQWDEIGGFPHKVRWEDAYYTVDVVFYPGFTRGTHTVQSIVREVKNRHALAALCFQRIFLCSLWLLGLALLARGMLTPKPVDALNSPPASDTTNGADSGSQGVALG